jgi:hypothetical protein
VLQISSEVHDRHPAATNLALQAIAAAEHGGERDLIIGEHGGEAIGGDALEWRIPSLAFGDEALELRSQRRVAAAELREQCRSALARGVEHRVDEWLEPPPLVGGGNA